MPGTLNYLNPSDLLTLSKMESYRQRAAVAGVRRAVELSLAPASDLALINTGQLPNGVDVREAQNILDFGTALDQWNTAALAAVGTAYSVFQAIPAPTLAANKLAVFYKIGVETVIPPVSRVIFRSGGAAGNIIAVYDLEPLYVHTILEGYFTEPVVIDPTDIFAVQVLCRIATGVLARVPFGCWIIERKGRLVA